MRSVSTKAEFVDLLQKAEDKLVVVDFTATWCGPCQRITPAIEKMEKEKEMEDVIFVKVDVDENQETAQHCGIKAMPTFQFFMNAKKIDEIVGANEDKIKTAIRTAKQ